MSAIKAYPLQWPSGWPRSKNLERSRFKTTLSSALSFLKLEVERLGGKGLVLSSNCTLGTENTKDPGVVAYFTRGETSIAIPCDRWNKVSDNVKAIGLTIEAMRGMDRWGAKDMITAMFKGFIALEERSTRSCWEILEITPEATEQQIMEAWRKLAAERHPDKAQGSTHAMIELNGAKDLALSTLKNR